MTPADLKPIIDRMSPGKWSSLRLHIISDEAGSAADMWDSDDLNAVISLRNHADALIKCASVLKRWYEAETGYAEMPSLTEIEQAINNLENIK
jgi:hypothetical protein